MRYLTAGESHGQCLSAVVVDFPAGLAIDEAAINAALRRRQGGYGRSARQAIESDTVAITSGVWRGTTIGSPITLTVANRDASLESRDDLTTPRPGHADLAGAMKYRTGIRQILERASARETAVVVALGALTQQLLEKIGVAVGAYVRAIGDCSLFPTSASLDTLTPVSAREVRDASELYSLAALNTGQDADNAAKLLIEECRRDGDSLGGIVEARAWGLPFGLGSHTQWDAKLDGLLAQGVMAIQSVKGVEIGLGFDAARRRGSEVHDPIKFDAVAATAGARHRGFVRPTNNAGGIEGGMSNAMPLVLRAALKPIPTMMRPLGSVDLATCRETDAAYERSDVCAVPAASVVVEAVVATVIARAVLQKFASDSISELEERITSTLGAGVAAGGLRF